MEKKTFKNVSSVINSFDPEHVWLVEGFRVDSHYFTHREWDMEVTFTKKVKPIVVGSKVQLASDPYGDADGCNPGTIVHTHGASVWLFWAHDRGNVQCWLAEDLRVVA